MRTFSTKLFLGHMVAAALMLPAPAAFSQDAGKSPQQSAAVPVAAPAGPAQATPVAPFQSIADADRVLADAAKERDRIEARYVEDERNCHPKFFTTACLDKVRETRRRDLANLRSIEVDARAYKRRTRAQAHDKAREQKAADMNLKQEEASEPVQKPSSGQ